MEALQTSLEVSRCSNPFLRGSPVMAEWPVESIPDGDVVYCRVHRAYVSDGEVKPAAFKFRDGEISTDWERYSTPAETQSRARRPAENAVVSLIAGLVRGIPLTVVHSPVQACDSEPGNRAHTSVLGDGSPESRVKLHDLLSWELRLPEL